jgi:hypothetical protein
MKKLLRRWLGIEQLETGFRAFVSQTAGDVERLQTIFNNTQYDLAVLSLELTQAKKKPKKKPIAKKTSKR